MSLRSRGLIVAALAALALSAVATPAPGLSAAGERATRYVAVGDDYYAPVELKIPRGTKVKWRWQPDNLDTHDVVLTEQHPKGVERKDFRSASGSIGIKFARVFEKPGKYGFVCTFHKTVMRMTVQVKRD